MTGENDRPPKSAPLINEGFTQGGDLTLRSTDGIEFNVHSLFLSVASPVFSELLQAGTKNETIQFSENGEVVALMLKFIYPRPTPIVSSIELMNDALRVANKYQIESMKSRLLEQFTVADSPVSVYIEPFGALRIASIHGVTATAELAAKLASEKHDFGQESSLEKLLDVASHPTTRVLIGLTGIPLVKARVLVEILFQFDQSPMIITSNAESLMCAHCRNARGNCSRRIPPEWRIHWAHWIFDKIKNRPIADWREFFNHSNFYTAFYQSAPFVTSNYCRDGQHTGSCTCIKLVLDSAAAFQSWANGVYECLKSKLTFVASLEDAQIPEPGPEEKKQ